MIYGARIRQARELREVQQQDVAAILGITGGRLAQIEQSDAPTSMEPAVQTALSAALRMPGSFFEVPAAEDLSVGSMRFRAQQRLTKRVTNRVRREAELTLELARAAERHLESPRARVPSTFLVTAEDAADAARAALGVPPTGPVPNVVRALEKAGVWVFMVDTRVEAKLDAFSTWAGPNLERPVIALGEGMAWDRQRHTTAHELGHLVMHRTTGTDTDGGKSIEQEADRFASAFLFPREDALLELPSPLTLSQLGPLKLRWGMSLQALVYRAHDLGVITPEHRASLFKQISARGWKKEEPGVEARAVERPRALRRMIELAYGTPVDIKKVAGEVGRFPSELGRDLDRYSSGPHAASPRLPRPRTGDNVVSILRPQRRGPGPDRREG